MNIKSAEFIKGIVGTNEILMDGKPQIAFVGSSNAGKSSLINALTGKKDLARSSSVPGKTQEINFFLIDGKTYFVDLPGYGFAKIMGKKREKVRKMIIWYLSCIKNRPKKVILVIDAKAGLKKFDMEMVDLLKEEGLEFIIIANKSDKISKNLIFSAKKDIAGKSGQKEENILFFSSKNIKNKEKVIRAIFD